MIAIFGALNLGHLLNSDSYPPPLFLPWGVVDVVPSKFLFKLSLAVCVCAGSALGLLGKEQCWRTAARAVQRSATCSSDIHELAILGFCSGFAEAMMPVCGATWMDRCWCELHSLKECLIERLLADGRAQWCEEGLDLKLANWLSMRSWQQIQSLMVGQSQQFIHDTPFSRGNGSPKWSGTWAWRGFPESRGSCVHRQKTKIMWSPCWNFSCD